VEDVANLMQGFAVVLTWKNLLFMLVGILLVACDPYIMFNQTSSLLGRVVVGATTLAMFGAGIAMFVL